HRARRAGGRTGPPPAWRRCRDPADLPIGPTLAAGGAGLARSRVWAGAVSERRHLALGRGWPAAGASGAGGRAGRLPRTLLAPPAPAAGRDGGSAQARALPGAAG